MDNTPARSQALNGDWTIYGKQGSELVMPLEKYTTRGIEHF
jgi:hypothetical protein